MNRLGLICTDLDGTLLGAGAGPEDFLAMKRLVLKASMRWRTRWVIATGRPLVDMQPLLMSMLTFGLAPDFLVLEDALIYRRNRRGRFTPLRWWNFRIRRGRARALWRHVDRVDSWRLELLRLFPSGVDRSGQNTDLWLKFDDEATAGEAEAVLQQRVGHASHFLVFRWGTELCLAPRVGTKGQAIDRLRARLRIPRSAVFAIGDGPNDLTMLDGSCAGLPACVGNALPRIQEAVRQAGGYVAKQENIKGVVEALQIHLGEV